MNDLGLYLTMEVETGAATQVNPINQHLLREEISIQEPLHDESHVEKRDAAALGDEEEKTAKKRRRSSLASKRRSIVNDALPQESLVAAEPENGPNESSGTSRVHMSSNDIEKPQKSGLKINPANLRNDKIIAHMEQKIVSLNQECTRWKQILSELSARGEETKQLASNLTLPSNDIPESVKDLALQRYVTSLPLDLSAVRDRVRKLMSQCQFDREACAKDIQLVVESLDAYETATDLKATLLSDLIDSAVRQSEVNHLNGDETVLENPHQIVQAVINS